MALIVLVKYCVDYKQPATINSQIFFYSVNGKKSLWMILLFDNLRYTLQWFNDSINKHLDLHLNCTILLNKWNTKDWSQFDRVEILASLDKIHPFNTKITIWPYFMSIFFLYIISMIGFYMSRLFYGKKCNKLFTLKLFDFS